MKLIKYFFIFIIIFLVFITQLKEGFKITIANWKQAATPVPNWSICTTNPPFPARSDAPYPQPGSSDLWCGGDMNPINQITCSPFNYRPRMFYHKQNCGIDSSEFYDTIMSNPYSEEDKEKNCEWVSAGYNGGARVWGHFDSNGKLMDNEYFVFHGCDSAGIQPDCFGDIKYIERFETKIGSGVKYIKDYPNGAYCVSSSIDKKNNNNSDYNEKDTRCYYTFVHPGTTYQYKNYAGGWWYSGEISNDAFNSHASGNWSSFTFDDYKNYFANYINMYAGKSDKTFSFMLYPWTCVQTNEFGNVNYFSYPHIGDNNYKCYVDNEPGSAGRPLFIEFYFGYVSWFQDSKTWRITYRCVTMDENMKFNDKGEKYLFPLCRSDNWQG